MKKVCIIYIQGNTQEELDTQITACEEYAEEKGYIVACEVIGSTKEKNHDELIDEAIYCNANIVLSPRLDTFSREALDLWRLGVELDINGVMVETVEGREDRQRQTAHFPLLGAFAVAKKLFSKNFKNFQKMY